MYNKRHFFATTGSVKLHSPVFGLQFQIKIRVLKNLIHERYFSDFSSQYTLLYGTHKTMVHTLMTKGIGVLQCAFKCYH